MATTYNDIRTTFLSRINRRDCTTAMADGFISDAIKRIQRVLRVRIAESSTQITVASGNYLTAGSMAIPTDYLGIIAVTHTNSAGQRTTLGRRPLEAVQHSVDFGVQGICSMWARDDNTWVVGALPLPGDIIKVDYYAQYSGVGPTTTDVGALLTFADDLVVYGALSYAASHWRDKRKEEFEGVFTQIISDIQQQADLDELSGGAAVAQAFTYPSDDPSTYYN